jgi:diguanylate cyclase (GGDEF)-like protein
MGTRDREQRDPGVGSARLARLLRRSRARCRARDRREQRDHRCADPDLRRRARRDHHEPVVGARCGDVAATDETRRQRFAAASADLERLGESAGSAGAEAKGLLENLRTYGLDDRDIAPIDVYYLGGAAISENRPLDEDVSADLQQLYALARIGDLAPLVLYDAAGIELVGFDGAVPEELTPLVDDIRDYIEGDHAGWLGPDPTAPVEDSVVMPDVVPTHPGIAEISALLADSSLPSVDVWAVDWVEDPAPAPVPLADLARETMRLDATIDAIVDDAISEQISRSELVRTLAMVAASALAAGGLAAIVGSVLRSRRRTRERLAELHVDALTGVGTRRVLTERTAKLAASPDYAHHVIATIDLDRFKLVNDSYGHGAGDAVLQAVGAALRDAVADVLAGSPGAVATIVRTGGDEFLVSLHSRLVMDETLLLSALSSRCGATVSFEGGRVEMSWSVGIASALGHASLDDLVRTADLAMYERKAAARHRRSGDLTLTDSKIA